MSKILSLKPEFDVIFKNVAMSDSDKLTAILFNTIAHYNIKNRCYADATGCMYSPLNTKGKLTYEDTEGCAVGRLFTQESALNLDMFSLTNSGIKNIIKLSAEAGYVMPQLIKDNEQFFFHLQVLHDEKLNWDENGITNAGMSKVAVLKLIIDNK